MSYLSAERAEVLTEEPMVQYHSERAMAAARKMRSTRQKRQTGQMVCHHLKMMLSAEQEKRVPTLTKVAVIGQLKNIENKVGEPANDQPQFQLGF